jgi:hypothetical protein
LVLKATQAHCACHRAPALRNYLIEPSPVLPEIGRMALMLEAGKGWAVSKESCRPDATFSAQAEPLVEIRTLERYTELDLIKT